jgi:hypothetical protein
VASNAATWKSDKKDSSIYDFSTYAEGEEAVRLLIQNGFDKMDLWLVGKERQGERRARWFGTGAAALRVALTRIGVSGKRMFNHMPAAKTGPHILMMHGNSVEAGKAHGVLEERTNALIQECLQFR